MLTGNLKALKMQLLRHWKDNRTIRSIILAFLALCAAVSVFQGARNALEFSQDFQWDAARALRDGMDPYEMSYLPQITESESPALAEFYRMYTDRGLTQKMEANQFPTLLMLLFPMTYLAPAAARCLWLALNLAFTAGIVILLRRTFFENADIYEYTAAILLMLAGTPYRNQLGVGQHTLFAFFFFMMAVYTEKKDVKKSPAGCVLTALCIFVSYYKYTLTAPLALYFIYKKRYKELALSVAAHVVLTGVFAVRAGKSFVYMIKAPLEVASNLATEGGIDLGVLFGSPLCYVVALVIGILLVAVTLKLPQNSENILISLLILWSLILTYHRTYDFFVLPAAAAFVCPGGDTDQNERDPAWFLVFAVLVMAVFFALRVFNENNASKICVGILYYAFTLAFTYVTIRTIKNRQIVTAFKGNNIK